MRQSCTGMNWTVSADENRKFHAVRAAHHLNKIRWLTVSQPNAWHRSHPVYFKVLVINTSCRGSGIIYTGLMWWNAGRFVSVHSLEAARETNLHLLSFSPSKWIFIFYIHFSEYFTVFSWPLPPFHLRCFCRTTWRRWQLGMSLLMEKGSAIDRHDELLFPSSFLHNPHNPSVLAANTAHSSGPQGHLLGGTAFCHHFSYQCTHGAVPSLTDAQIHAQDANRRQHTAHAVTPM